MGENTSNCIVDGGVPLFCCLVICAECIDAVISVHVRASLTVLRSHADSRKNESQPGSF